MGKYYKCGCNQSISNTYGVMCTSSVSYRFSGICGGRMDIEIDEIQYRQIKSQWRQKNRINKINKINKLLNGYV